MKIQDFIYIWRKYISEEGRVMSLSDCDIRPVLKAQLIKKYTGTNTVIVDELPICWGDSRIDIAVINCSLHGYEIKSDRDTLDRLPRQIELNNKIFDYITLVCSSRLIANARKKIPEYWGLQVPVEDKKAPGGVRIEVEREPKRNEAIDIRSIVELTWKEEAINILAERGLARGYRSRPRWDIWDHMIDKIEHQELIQAVRECLKLRKWQRKPETLHKLYAD